VFTKYTPTVSTTQHGNPAVSIPVTLMSYFGNGTHYFAIDGFVKKIALNTGDFF
jgi:hypothetical protein